jgi:hypothetical protein
LDISYPFSKSERDLFDHENVGGNEFSLALSGTFSLSE